MTVKDIFDLRKQGRIEEARKIYEALNRMLRHRACFSCAQRFRR